jgi:hypothetical protein
MERNATSATEIVKMKQYREKTWTSVANANYVSATNVAGATGVRVWR